MKKSFRIRVGVFGGSFDPVHNGHIGLASQVQEKFRLDHILFIPACISPHKQDRRPAAPHHRLKMLQLANDPHPCFLISDIELKRKEVSYTVDTLSALTDKQPDTEFFLIMGNDTFAGIKTWKSVQRVLGMCHTIVCNRPGFTLERIEESLANLFPDSASLFSPPIIEEEVTIFQHREKETKLIFFDLAPMDISSSIIRKNVNNHLQIKNMLPLEVENYIIKNQLYQAKSHL